MNPFEFVIAIIVITGIFSLIRARMRMRDGIDAGIDRAESAEKARLEQQVTKLQDRIKVLERIVTDRGVETAAQIEALRDRDCISEDESNG